MWYVLLVHDRLHVVTIGSHIVKSPAMSSHVWQHYLCSAHIVHQHWKHPTDNKLLMCYRWQKRGSDCLTLLYDLFWYENVKWIVYKLFNIRLTSNCLWGQTNYEVSLIQITLLSYLTDQLHNIIIRNQNTNSQSWFIKLQMMMLFHGLTLLFHF